MATTARQLESERMPQWEGFNVGLWQSQINVRDFIQQNYTEFHGDDSFLAPATERTKKIWAKLNELFLEERKKGVLDVSQIPSGITAHAPGYIDRDNEVIVGLQTEAPLKRAIMPNGGCRCERLFEHKVTNRGVFNTSRFRDNFLLSGRCANTKT
jgi:formate C-acetyltransferase